MANPNTPVEAYQWVLKTRTRTIYAGSDKQEISKKLEKILTSQTTKINYLRIYRRGKTMHEFNKLPNKKWKQTNW